MRTKLLLAVVIVAAAQARVLADTSMDRHEKAVRDAMAQFSFKPQHDKALRVRPKDATLELRFTYTPERAAAVAAGGEQAAMDGTINLRVFGEPTTAATWWAPSEEATRRDNTAWKLTVIKRDGVELLVQGSEATFPARDKVKLSATRIVTWRRDRTVTTSMRVSLECTCDPKNKDAVLAALDKEARALAEYLDDRWKEPSNGDDGYWKWLETVYLPRRAKTRDELGQIGKSLAALARKRQEVYQRWQKLFVREIQLYHQVVDPKDGEASPGVKMTESLRAQRQTIKAEMDRNRAEQESLMKRAVKALEDEIDSLREETKKFGPKRADVPNSVEMLAGQKKQQLMTLYDLARWYRPQELPQLIDDIKQEGGYPREQIARMEIKARLAMADDLDRREWLNTVTPAGVNPKSPYVGAGDRLRTRAHLELLEYLRQNPKDQDAEQMLLELEFPYLNAAQAKVRHEKAFVATMFGEYLEKRGFSTKDASDWPTEFKNNIHFIWGSGPLTILAGFNEVFGYEVPGYDVPKANAEAVGIAQQNLAQFDVALTMMKRLRAAGLPLAQVRRITPELMRKYTPGEAKLTDDQIRHFCRDIRETFVYLGDLNALADGKVEQARRLVNEQLFEGIDVQQDWGEWGADLFSPRHLLLLVAPGGVAKVGKEWATVSWGLKEARFFTTAGEMTGEVMTVRQWLAGAMRLEAVGEKMLEHSPELRLFLENRATARLALAQSGRVTRFLFGTRDFAVAAILLGGAGYLAEEHLDPRLAFLVQAALELGAADILWDVLNDLAVPFGRMASRMEALAADAARKEARAAELLDEADKFAAAVGKLVDADQANIATLETAIPQSVRDAIAAPAAGTILPEDALEAWAVARTRAIAAWKAGDYKEAVRALEFGKRMLTTVKGAAGTMRQKAGAAAQLVRQKMARRPAAMLPTTTEPAMTAFRPHLLDPALKKAETSGHILASADEALCNLDVETAITHYREARKIAEIKKDTMLKTGNDAEAQLQQRVIDAVDHRLATLENAKAAQAALKRWEAAVPHLTADEAIPAKAIKELTDFIAAGHAPQQLKGSFNPVFVLKTADGKKFIFKHLGLSRDTENEILVELVGAALAKKLGIPAPSVTRVKLGKIRDVELLRYKTGPDGKLVKNRRGDLETETVIQDIETDGILMPFIEGHEAYDLKESVGQALNAQIARIRVFKALLGDSDAQLRNMRLGDDGRLWAHDFGFGNLRDDGILRQASPPGELPSVLPDDKYLFWVFRLADRIKANPLYAWPVRFDKTTRFEDVLPVIQEIERLCADKGAGMREALENVVPADRLDETVRVLVKRGERLKAAADEYYKHIKTTSQATPRKFNVVPELRDDRFAVAV